MTRRAVAILAGSTLVIGIWVLLFPSQVRVCLGPLNVTPESCRAAMGLPPATDWDRFASGPGPVLIVAVIGYAAIGLWAVRRRRQRAGL